MVMRGLVAGAGLVLAVRVLSAQTPPPAPQTLPPAPQTQPPAPQAGAPVFRGRTTVVPVDVRVTDRNGRPVTDLTADDFAIFENGVRQTVEYFSAQPLTPASAAADAAVRPTDAPLPSLAPASRRVFLILLGRGRLQEPSKGVDATLRFVRERLMAQDQVAVMAWNRATAFTADRAPIVQVLERFRDRHEEIEHELRLYFTDLFGLYAGAAVPPHIQTLIDAVFGPRASSAARTAAPVEGLERAARDARAAITGTLDRNAMDTFRLFGGRDVAMASGLFDPTLQMSFSDYIALSRQTMQDTGNLYAGLDYLRFIPGEKHLVFVTEQGLSLPRADYERDLAAFASDARVVLDTIQTGGVASVLATGPGGAYVTVQNGLELRALREMSDLTGGISSVSKYAEQAFDRLLGATSFGYLLGYTPIRSAADGKVREIKVTVARRNVHAAYRHAYIARADAATYDPRESMAAARLMAAVNAPRDIADLRFTTKLLDRRDAGRPFVNVEVTLDAARLRLAKAGDRWVAALNFAILCGDYDQRDIGQLWESKDVFVPDSRLAEIRASGLTVTLSVPVRQPPIYVRIIVYDYGSDQLGSVTRTMR